MNRKWPHLAILLLTGCVTSGTMEKPDSYVRAATSWKGGHIRDMISVWGQPNNGYVEPSEYMHGMAGWKFDEKEKPNPYAEVKERTSCSGQVTGSYGNVDVNCKTYDANAFARQGYELGAAGSSALLKHCSTTVQFDQSGTIFDVTASSKNCGSTKEGAADALTRQTSDTSEKSAAIN